MACLEAAMAEHMESVVQSRAEGASKVRLVADPMITVSQIQDIFQNYMTYKKTGDLWSLVCPPPSGPGWHTPVCGPWISKVIGLLYDFLSIAENTKLQSTKVQKALQVLYTNKVLTVSVPKNSKLEDVLDKMDTAVRILLAMLRTLKTCETLKAKVFRMLSREEQVRIELCLDKIKLPANFWSPSSEEELGKPKSVCTAIVPYEAEAKSLPGASRLPLALSLPEAKKCKVEEKEPVSIMPHSLKPVPSIFERILKG